MNLRTLAERFCSAPLPESVCADPCASMQGYPNRTGTNLLTVVEAEAILSHTLGALPSAARDVLAERQRQTEGEGWTLEHDDEHEEGELAMAAACYALDSTNLDFSDCKKPLSFWPWAPEWWKPTDRRRMLVKAGALILAEIERLDRAAARG